MGICRDLWWLLHLGLFCCAVLSEGKGAYHNVPDLGLWGMKLYELEGGGCRVLAYYALKYILEPVGSLHVWFRIGSEFGGFLRLGLRTGF